LLDHPRYRAGWDFLDLRCKSGEFEGELAALAQWWDRFAAADPAGREAMLTRGETPAKRRRSRRRGGKRRDEDAGTPADAGSTA
jgi:poly(A) polymerase